MKIIELNKENQINKVLRDQRKEKSKIHILFHSPQWDEYAKELNDAIKLKYSNLKNPTDVKLYLIDTFDMPHSYMIFKTTKCPELISISSDDVMRTDYLPNIYKRLELS